MIVIYLLPMFLSLLIPTRGCHQSDESIRVNDARSAPFIDLLNNLSICRIPSAIEGNRALRAEWADKSTALYVVLKQKSQNDQLTNDEQEALRNACLIALGTSPTHDWVVRYKPFLRNLIVNNFFTAEQVDELNKIAAIDFQTPKLWPRGKQVGISAVVLSATDYPTWTVSSLRSLIDSEIAFQPISQQRPGDSPPALVWTDGLFFVERSGPGVIAFQVTLKNGTLERIASYSFPVGAIENANQIIETVQSDSFQQIVTRQVPTLQTENRMLYVTWPIESMATSMAKEPGTTLALVFVLNDGDKVIAKGEAWWSTALDENVFPEIVYRVHPTQFWVPMDIESDIPRGKNLKLTVQSSSDVAIRDLNSNRMYAINAQFEVSIPRDK